jgi:hypothetical protein
MSEETVNLPKMKTGYLVLIDADGNSFIDRSTELINIDFERSATLLEVRRSASEVLMDLQAQAAAEYTRIALTQMEPPPEAE